VGIETVSKQTLGVGVNPAVKRSGKLVCSSSNFPAAEPGATPTPSYNSLKCSTSNLPEDNMIVSPSPLVSWHTGACMVESRKQLFLLTPLPKTKECSSRCPTSKVQLKTTSSLDQLDLPNLPVWKLTIADDDHPDPEQVVKVKEARTGTATPNVTATNKGSLEDRSPCTFSVQKNMRSLPRSCLRTALSSKQQIFSPIPEGSRKEGISSDGTTQGDSRSKACDDVSSSDEISKDLASRYDMKRSKACYDLSSSDEISKDLASRYDLYGFNQFSKNIHRRRETGDTLQWFLSPLKTCVLMDPSDDDKPNPTPATINMRGQQDIPDDKPVQTPALHCKALLATPWKGLESTNLKGRRAGETTLKKELWTRFEAVSTDELHFDKSLFQKIEGNRFMDMLEEEATLS
jgi:hypothetical protein